MPFFMNNSLTISSPAFENEGDIPSKYTCEGQNVNPEITIKDVPDNTQSLALIMDDPDAPTGTFDHWIMWNIPANTKTIDMNSHPGTQGKNGRGENKYTGPCPPTGKHRYYFKVYALDKKLSLAEGSTKAELENAMQGHILASGQLMGKYEKKK